MINLAKILAISVIAVLVIASPALAQDEVMGFQGSGSLGAGLTCIGAGYGIGRLAGCALESMARQPEVAGSIQTAMIIAAALIEGFTFFALFVCWGQNPWPAQ